MRVLFVSQDFPPDVGGIQTYSWEIARRLRQHVTDLAVVAPARNGSRVVDASIDAPVYRLRARPDLLPIMAAASLPRIAKRHAVDISFHAQWQTAAAALMSRRVTGFPRKIAVAAHGRELLFNPLNGPAGVAYHRLRRYVLERVDLFLPVSRYTARLLDTWDVDPVRMRIVHNGTDPDRFRPIGDSGFRNDIGAGDRPLLLFVGRLVKRKGLQTVIESIETLRQSVPEVLFAIAGDGPFRAELEQLVARRSLEYHLRFVGAIQYDNLAEVYSAADVFVMPSTDSHPDVEGFGIVFLEANACACPVVGTRSGGIPDAIIHGETGLLVDQGDVHGLAGALTQLLTDRTLRERLGRQGRERILRELTWDHVAERVAGALGSVR